MQHGQCSCAILVSGRKLKRTGVDRLCAGVPRAKGDASASCVAAYRLTQGGAEPAGLLLPSGVKMLSFVRSLPAVDAFLTGGPSRSTHRGL